ncbi:uncharacterized protein LOC108148487 isoform X9 [Drosophila elegans]|uniref:uncharacterized protein LOC108148487 isoform X9 n=1 Tax=Drosophila elegans TaxID=30023 RepID=UPI001BC85ADA|nr:uncharacterized protein LOC108148487 isoform X9 [Drosophila elegans]
MLCIRRTYQPEGGKRTYHTRRTEKDRSDENDYATCSKQHNFENVELIQNCFDSDHGVELLKRNGEATHALRPSVTFIPTITIDGSQGRQASILKDLFSEVCKAAGESEEAKSVCINNKSN